MEIKHIRILDAGTDYWACAARIKHSLMSTTPKRAWRSGGFAEGAPYVLFMPIMPVLHIDWDPANWANRTRRLAHDELVRHWDDYEAGDTIDVQTLTSNLLDRFVPKGAPPDDQN